MGRESLPGAGRGGGPPTEGGKDFEEGVMHVIGWWEKRRSHLCLSSSSLLQEAKNEKKN